MNTSNVKKAFAALFDPGALVPVGWRAVSDRPGRPGNLNCCEVPLVGVDPGQLVRERLFEPLGMTATSFAVPADRLDRLPPSYLSDGLGGLAVHDDPRASRWGGDIQFESGGGGLVSTIDDYHAFYRMLLRKGRHDGGRVLARPSIELMTGGPISSAHGVAGWGAAWR